jgi:hypothetical protein
MISTLRGNVSIDLPNGRGNTRVTLKDAYYVPNMTRTLISVGKLDQARYSAEFGRQRCIIRAPDRKVIAQLLLINGLYKVNEKPPTTESANIAVQKVSLAEARWIMGHVSHSAVKAAIAEGRIARIVLDDSNSAEFCDACTQAKPHCKPFPKEAKHRATEFRERIFTDLWSPASIESLGKKRYSLDFTDDMTRWTEADFLENKTQTLASYKTFEQQIATQDGAIIKFLRSDVGMEFKNKVFDAHLAERGTKRELTVHDTHEQVGVSERLNRTKLELAQAMLIDSSLPKFLWAEAVHHGIWIQNRSPTRALDGKTPYEAWKGHILDLSQVPPFGTRAWVKIHKAGKLVPRARLGYFVGMHLLLHGGSRLARRVVGLLQSMGFAAHLAFLFLQVRRHTT